MFYHTFRVNLLWIVEYLCKEYQNGAEHFNLDLKQLLYISRMAMESSFADTKTKDLLVKQINEWSID